ncbi:hypothetical protein KA005_01075 [bacterium]|nr:hypothetical protein [bacterium]
MKQLTVEVKSKGTVVDTVTVAKYENIKEATDAIGAETALAHINKCVSDGITNAARAAKVRPSTPQAQLNAMAKKDPKVKAEIEALLKKYRS